MRGFWFGMLMLCGIATAQESNPIPGEPLALPDSPAAAVMGMQPNVVLRPKSMRALESALYTGFRNADGDVGILDDIALEFTPYWWKNHGLTIEEYLSGGPAGKQLWRNASFSIATAQKFLLGDSTATKALGLGFRTSVFFGNQRDADSIRTLLTSVRDGMTITAGLRGIMMNSNATTKQTLLEDIRPRFRQLLLDTYHVPAFAEEVLEESYRKAETLDMEATPEGKRAFVSAFREVVRTVVGSHYDDLKAYMLKREGLRIDFAYGSFLSFPTNETSYSMVPRQSLWVAPSWRFGGKLEAFSLTGVLRYEWYNTRYFDRYFPGTEVFRNNFDYGFALSAEFDKLSVSAEAVGRSASTLEAAGTSGSGETLYVKRSDSDFQYSASITYRLTADIALNYQFGSTFRQAFDQGETLLSVLSVNFGFGGPKKNKIL